MDRNEAIKVIKDNWPESRHQLSEALQTLIPELRESKGERIRKEIIQFLQLPHPQFVGKRNHEEWIAWLENEKQGKQLEYNWSKEDIMHFNRCLGYIDAYVEPRRDDVEWFKSLKDRIKGKQKPTWSEEDERMFTLCASSVRTRYNDGLLTYNEYEQASLWLKSLKERMKVE